MKCDDKKIIDLILSGSQRAEKKAIKCLENCTDNAKIELKKTGLIEVAEAISIINEALAIFINNVRKKKFELRPNEAKICTYVNRVAVNIRINDSRKNKPIIYWPTASQNQDELIEKVKKVLGLLYAADRAILIAFYNHNCSLKEYAEEKGISHHAAKKDWNEHGKDLKKFSKT